MSTAQPVDDLARLKALAKSDPTKLSDADWRLVLSPEDYRILRQAGTERPFQNKYWKFDADGSYRCKGCGVVLFTNEGKFFSDCGWPAFSSPAFAGRITERLDTSHGMVRTEVLCARCGGHLGHVFNDGPGPNGLRYCINSASIAHDTSTDDATAPTPKPAAKP